ncbi:MAG: glutamyl-tRNA reductase [Vicinamibacterales bacterium]
MRGQAPRLVMAGADFTSSPVHERERVACPADRVRAALHAARGIQGVREGMVLSTCNRTEFYLVVTQTGAMAEWTSAVTGITSPGVPAAIARSLLWDDDAVRHLLRVACGLESLLLGDAHIAGQVRAAFALSAECGTSGPRFAQLAQRVGSAVRRARTGTAIGYGASSHGSAVAALLRAHRTHEGGGPTLVVGAGQMAREVSAALAKAGIGPLRWVNRSLDAAERLAAKHGGTAVPWASLADELARAGAAVSAVGAGEPVITASLLHGHRPPPLIVDLGVPRNVATDVHTRVLTIDEVREHREDVLARRQAAVPAVERVIEDEVGLWQQWLAARPMERLIRQLFLEEERQRRALVSSLLEEPRPAAVTVERLVKRSVRRLLHSHVMALRHGGMQPVALSFGGGRRRRLGEEA